MSPKKKYVLPPKKKGARQRSSYCKGKAAIRQKAIVLQPATLADDGSFESESNELMGEPDIKDIHRLEQDATTTTLMRRHAIAYHYLIVLGAPPKVDWDGKGGTVGKIVQALLIPPGSSNLVKKVLLDVEYAILTGSEYDGTVDLTNMGRPSTIEKSSIELQIIADAIKGGQSMDDATVLVNEHRQEDGKEPLGRTAVYKASLSLAPNVTTIQSMSQGEGRPASSNYHKARY